MLGVMGREDLRGHVDFSRVEWRIANNGQVDDIVSDWVARHEIAELERILGAADVPCSPVRTPPRRQLLER